MGARFWSVVGLLMVEWCEYQQGSTCMMCLQSMQFNVPTLSISFHVPFLNDTEDLKPKS